MFALPRMLNFPFSTFAISMLFVSIFPSKLCVQKGDTKEVI